MEVGELNVQYRDFFESLVVFGICLISSFVLLSIHASYFTPYIEKNFMVELALFLTCITGLVVGYEWMEIKKEKRN